MVFREEAGRFAVFGLNGWEDLACPPRWCAHYPILPGLAVGSGAFPRLELSLGKVYVAIFTFSAPRFHRT